MERKALVNQDVHCNQNSRKSPISVHPVPKKENPILRADEEPSQKDRRTQREGKGRTVVHEEGCGNCQTVLPTEQVASGGAQGHSHHLHRRNQEDAGGLREEVLRLPPLAGIHQEDQTELFIAS